MPEIRVVYASEGEWIGIYVDDELITQGHTLDPTEVLNAVGLDNHDEVGIDFRAAGWKKLPESYSKVEKVLEQQDKTFSDV